MSEAAMIADLQYKIAQLSQEVDRYQNDKVTQFKAKAVLKKGNINVSDERTYRLEAVSSVLDNLRNEFEAIKLSSESNIQPHSCGDHEEKDVSESDTLTDIDSLESTFSSSIGSSSLTNDYDTETETQSIQDPNEVETFVITLKGKSKLQPFAQLLPNVFSRVLQAETLMKETSTEDFVDPRTSQNSSNETQTICSAIGTIDKESSCDLQLSVTKVVSTQTDTDRSSSSPLESLLPNVFNRVLEAEHPMKGTSTETIQHSLAETQTNFTPIRTINKRTGCDLHSSIKKDVSTQTYPKRNSNSSLENLRNLGLHESVDTAKFIINLKEKAQLQPFAQLLPVIIDVVKIFPTAEVQLECIRLIQTNVNQNLSELNAEQRANLVETMLTCLQSNFNEESIVYCCTDQLAQLEIFADPMEKYTKTVEILLKIISNGNMNTKRKTIRVFRGIVAKSDENRRNLVGQIGGVEQICGVIRQQLDNPTYDRILVFSWVCLENLCCLDSLENYKKFLSAGGIDLFHHCYEKFGDEVEMVEEMMEMMWNLTVFASVRPQLVSKRNFDLFWKILLKFNYNVAISYRCVDTFNNFLSDSTIIWPLDSPTVEETKNLMIETINKWKLDATTHLNISSFVPNLDVLKLHKFSLADLLVIWTIANLTTVDAFHYCRMLRDEGGVEILTTEVIRHLNSSLDAVVLTKMAIDNVNKWAKSAIQH